MTEAEVLKLVDAMSGQVRMVDAKPFVNVMAVLDVLALQLDGKVRFEVIERDGAVLVKSTFRG
jgi:signal recognition particle GTPase